MNATPLQVLRLAVPGAPTLQILADRIGCSNPTLSTFELGQRSMSEELVKAYAREVRTPVQEVRRRFLESRLSWLEQQLRLTRAELRDTGGRRPGRRVGSAA